MEIMTLSQLDLFMNYYPAFQYLVLVYIAEHISQIMVHKTNNIFCKRGQGKNTITACYLNPMNLLELLFTTFTDFVVCN